MVLWECEGASDKASVCVSSVKFTITRHSYKDITPPRVIAAIDPSIIHTKNRNTS